MSGQNLTDLDLVAAAEGVAAGRFSARELVEAALQRIERWNPVVNAFISVDADACLQAADAADAARAAGRDLGPLHGVPLAHKDLFDRKGYQATCGSKVRRDRVAAGTATVLERLDAAGALNLGGLNMSELATGPTGHNLHYGHCRNPWNPERFTGGSSSGTGAAVAARLVPGGLGTDTGGSIRLPSAFCGIVGLKPTQGRVSRHGVMGLSFSLDNIGPMTRTVRDCARMTDVLAGHDPLDTTSARLPPPNCEAAVGRSVRGLRVGVVEDGHYTRYLSTEAAALLEDAKAVLAECGATLVPVSLPHQELLANLSNIFLGAEACMYHGRDLIERPDDIQPQVRARQMAGFGYPALAYTRALQLRGPILREVVATGFAGADVILLPIINTTARGIAETDVGSAPGMAEFIAQVSNCSRPLNYLGLPGLVSPCGFDSEGMPMAFQLMGRPYDEETLFQVAAAYEAETRWCDRSPPEPS